MFAPLLLAPLLAAPAFAASASDWQKRSIYQLVTDRFAVTNDNGGQCDTEDRVYCGGSYQGIVNHLDYIQNMGFDAIWISPIMANFEGNSTYGEAFHGYWPVDLKTTNAHFGSADDLKALSAALHKRGMYLMVDVVVNHLAATSDTPDFTKFPQLNAQADFHPFCWVTDYNNQTDVEQCWLGDEHLALVDVDTEDDAIVAQLNQMAKDIVGNFSADGLRIDTVKHVRKDFWPGFASAAGVYTIGEVLNNDTSYIAPYTQVLDAALDYSTWFPLVAAFQTQYGNLSALAATAQLVQSSFKNGAFSSGSFLENHDQPRFASLNNDTSRTKNAMAWPFVYDGVPILYYGQEQGYAGGADPANREALWSSGYAQDKPLVKHVAALNGARKAAINGSSTFLTTKATFPLQSTTQLAVAKYPLLSLLTNTGSAASASWSVPGSGSGYAKNTDLVDVISCTKVTTGSDGSVSASSSDGSPVVLIPASMLNKNGNLCASLATGDGKANSSSSGSGSGSGSSSAAMAARPALVSAALGALGLVAAALFA